MVKLHREGSPSAACCAAGLLYTKCPEIHQYKSSPGILICLLKPISAFFLPIVPTTAHFSVFQTFPAYFTLFQHISAYSSLFQPFGRGGAVKMWEEKAHLLTELIN